MDTLSLADVADLFESVGNLFVEKKDELCEMDAAMGDGDLGLTMSKGYSALPGFLRDFASENDLGKMLFKGAMKMQNLVPSTMGTLMASGVMEAGKNLKGQTELAPADLVTFATAFAAGIQKRGKCELGDRTIFDSVDAAAKKATAFLENNAEASFTELVDALVTGASEGCEATKDMLPKYGKAAVHAAKAKGVIDQGALAGQYVYAGMKNYFSK
ncbi:dihydroxyacetone kinase subunit L [Atopobium fossor]|uniref:dihydroxyacetone kinase subunit L n=1 Tax=Atopobium fossor TaxID=39487 RepID=UPI00040171A6|nr:dihydroxyacetone kinase subunit L [Atopobium fossor]